MFESKQTDLVAASVTELDNLPLQENSPFEKLVSTTKDSSATLARVDNAKQRMEFVYTTLHDVAGLPQLCSLGEDVFAIGDPSCAAETLPSMNNCLYDVGEVAEVAHVISFTESIDETPDTCGFAINQTSSVADSTSISIVVGSHVESNLAANPLIHSSKGDFTEDEIKRNEENTTVTLSCVLGTCTNPTRHATLGNFVSVGAGDSGGNKNMEHYEESAVVGGLADKHGFLGYSAQDKAREGEVNMTAQLYEDAGLSTEMHKPGWLGTTNGAKSGSMEKKLLYGNSEQQKAVQTVEQKATEFHDESDVPIIPEIYLGLEESELEEVGTSEDNKAVKWQVDCDLFIGAKKHLLLETDEGIKGDNSIATSYAMSDVPTAPENNLLIDEILRNTILRPLVFLAFINKVFDKFVFNGADAIRWKPLTDVVERSSPTLPLFNGRQYRDIAMSAIKQATSEHFRVTPICLVKADQLEIQVAQGARLGKGGEEAGHSHDGDYFGLTVRVCTGRTGEHDRRPWAAEFSVLARFLCKSVEERMIRVTKVLLIHNQFFDVSVRRAHLISTPEAISQNCAFALSAKELRERNLLTGIIVVDDMASSETLLRWELDSCWIQHLQHRKIVMENVCGKPAKNVEARFLIKGWGKQFKILTSINKKSEILSTVKEKEETISLRESAGETDLGQKSIDYFETELKELLSLGYVLILALGLGVVIQSLSFVVMGNLESKWELKETLAARRNATGGLAQLVKGDGHFALDHSWMSSTVSIERLHSNKFEGKLGFVGRSIDRFEQAYYHNRKTEGKLKQGEGEMQEEELQNKKQLEEDGSQTADMTQNEEKPEEEELQMINETE